MFKRLKNYFRRSRPKYPIFQIIIGPEHVEVLADWADPDTMTAEQIASYSNRTASTLVGISNGGGPGLNEFERAIGKNAELRKDQAFANRLIGNIRMILANKQSSEFYNQENEFLVYPDRTFPGSNN